MSGPYDKYLFATKEPIDELHILEIAGGITRYGQNASPIYTALTTRNARRIKYRNIERREERRPPTQQPETEKPPHIWTSKDGSMTIDELTLFQGAENIPYPFEDEHFHEIHCHMIDSPVAQIPPARRGLLSLDNYASEVKRLLKPGGRFFLTTQYIFGDFFGSASSLLEGDEAITRFVCSMEYLRERLEANGFIDEVVSFGNQEHLRRNMSEELQKKRPEIWPLPYGFTDYEGCVDAFLIATKNTAQESLTD